MEAMAMASILLLSFLIMVMTVNSISYSVGDGSGWAVGVDYNAWAANKTFVVGDILSFIYSPSHTVVEVAKSDYQSCSNNNSFTINNSGSTQITLDSVGNYYFICGTAGHCAKGMKLAIAVSASGNKTGGNKPGSAPPPATLIPPPPPLNLPPQSRDKDDEIKNVESLQYDFNTISIATNHFSNANKLGEGGFGAVYKGRLLEGQEIAVKRLSSNSRQGEKEFKNEVLLVAKLQHRNLVRLLGFCLEKTERLLIYEFVPNASLDQFIFDPIRRAYLDWQTRFKILGGIARGLLYLHEDSHFRIIHRDLKASNILLDVGMNPKISDFGIARLFVMDESQGNTNTIVGTYGYMAPEYVMHGQFSVKSDVFSFGVLLLEIISGQKNNSFHQLDLAQDLLCYAWKHWMKGTAAELIDSSLREKCSRHEVMRCIQIGLLCVQDDVIKRPTMASIILMLNSNSVTLPWPSPPAFLTHNLSNSQMDAGLFHENLATPFKISRIQVWGDGKEPASGSSRTEFESHPKRATPPRVFGV